MNYKHDYPLYDVKPIKDFKDMLEQAEKEVPDKIAYRYKKGGDIVDVTYSEFIRDTRVLGTGLASIGAGKAHVAIVAENRYEWIAFYLSVLNSEGVFLPADRELPASELAHVLDHGDAEYVIYSATYSKKIEEISPELKKVKKFISIDCAHEGDDRFMTYEMLYDKGASLFDAGDTSYTSLEPKFDELKMLVYTSGTTGAAKGVMLSLKNLVSGVYYGLQVSTVYEVGMSVLPYNHTYEAVCDLLVSLHHHSTVCINDSLRNVAANMKLFKPEYIMLVPLFVENIYKKIRHTIEQSGKAKAFDKLVKASAALRRVGVDMRPVMFKSVREVFGGKLKKIVCGGAPIRPELAEFFDVVGINLINGYGITECSPLVSANRDMFNDFRSVGVKLPCIDVFIDEPNDDGEGEICVKGDIVMLGYYKNPEATKAAFTETGFFRTGDYGKINEANQIFITGRKKNLIVLKNGKNVYPEEIEEYIMGLPYIAEVVVYALKNENGEETALCAEIFPDDIVIQEHSPAETAELIKTEIDRMNDTLPSYKKIAKVKLRNVEFEKTTSRKIRRVGLGSGETASATDGISKNADEGTEETK